MISETNPTPEDGEVVHRQWNTWRVLSLVGIVVLGSSGAAFLFELLGSLVTPGRDISDFLVGLAWGLMFLVAIPVAVLLFRAQRDRLAWKITMWMWISWIALALALGVIEGVTNSS